MLYSLNEMVEDWFHVKALAAASAAAAHPQVIIHKQNAAAEAEVAAFFIFFIINYLKIISIRANFFYKP